MREVREETGLELDGVPAPFLDTDFDPDQRWHVYDRGHWAWYAVRVPASFEPQRDGWTDEELRDMVDWRWMSATELEAEAASAHETEPTELPDLVRANTPPKGNP
nr:NUDIX domain-containing protein [Pseudolysinimonas kribbensis]